MELETNNSEPYLLHISHNKKIILEQAKQLTIGRGLCNSYVIEDVVISRIHCSLHGNNGVWYVTDKSSNGTLINRRKIPPKVPQLLSCGDVISLTDDQEFMFIHINNDSLDSIDFSAVIDEGEVSNIAQEVEVTSNIGEQKIDNKEVLYSLTLNEASNVKSTVPETTVCESILYVNSDNSDHSYTKSVTPLAKNKDIEIVPSTSSTSNITEQIHTDKTKMNEKSQPRSSNRLEQVEDELQCIICTELFVKATTLNCSHSFCKYCIEEWRKKNKKCPICRTKITTANPTIVLDNFISKVLESAPDDVKQHRDEVIKSRDVLPAHPATRSTTKRTTRTRDTPPIEISSEDEEDNSDEDYDDMDFDDMDYYDDSSSRSSRRPPYYGGYGHCFVCGDTGHWANGCPFR